jgi:hypothetical protein
LGTALGPPIVRARSGHGKADPPRLRMEIQSWLTAPQT